MLDNLVRGGARIMNSACFIDQFGCTDKGVPRYDYDPAKAKKLLAEAAMPTASPSISMPIASANLPRRWWAIWRRRHQGQPELHEVCGPA